MSVAVEVVCAWVWGLERTAGDSVPQWVGVGVGSVAVAAWSACSSVSAGAAVAAASPTAAGDEGVLESCTLAYSGGVAYQVRSPSPLQSGDPCPVHHRWTSTCGLASDGPHTAFCPGMTSSG